MKKKALFLIFIFILVLFISSINLASSQSIDSSIKKMTHTAEQYKTGSINYAQLIVYMASLSKELAAEMGATSQEHDQILKQEQLERALGKPTETTEWVWVENEEREKKMDKEIPAWRKIIFDGKNIQMYLGAWPNIRKTNNDDEIVYRLNTEIIFKSQEDEIDIKNEINKIKTLAQDYSSNPSKDNLENLAKESVNIEQTFNNNPYKNSQQCETNMNDLFGSENKRDTQNIILQEINFVEGDNFQAKIRLEMCDECEWHWINMNMWFESRGKFPRIEENKNYNENFRQKYESYTTEDFKREIESTISETKSNIEKKDYESAMNKMQELNILTQAWNEKSNNVWQEIEGQYKVDFESMTQEEREECSKNYCWIKKDQERKIAEEALKDKNHEERKQFFLNLFSGYDKKESYSSQEQWEKRLFEEFKEFGEEMCSNNIDDNDNQQIDCAEQQCGGKVCGSEKISILDENGQTIEQTRDLYCIASSCQAKIETLEIIGPVCGNNICEENETETCSSDCAICKSHEAVACEGKVIFSGEDSNSCPLAPICLIEKLTCETDNDCIDPLCGDSSCMEGQCQLLQLTECREAECIDGEEKRISCNSGDKLVSEICMEGQWRETGLECPTAEPATEVSNEIPETQEEIISEPITEEVVGNACTARTDCGNDNDVCSNGICVTLPEIISEEPISDEVGIETSEQSEEQESSQEPSNEQTSENTEPESTITGNAVSNFFKFIISGFQIEGGEGSSSGSSGENTGGGTGENTQLSPEQENRGQFNSPPEENRERENGEREDRENREQQDQERREKECGERCDRECYDREIRPYTENCIREECGNELTCNIDEVRTPCEEKAKSETDVESCTSDCSTKCLAGQDTWVEPEREEHKEEKFVFTVGGSCRQEGEKLQENIWFGGWGNEFKDFHLVKEEYYTRGGTDWCEREYENLIRQRQELEKSLNEEFASWFFEDYVASSAEDWKNHMSGIFEIYWKDVDLSRQLVERAQCLDKKELPSHNLINFEYETDYGSIKFWEEIKTARISEDSEETEIISPYMETYLSPPREFYALEMKKATESHRIPGPEGKESSNFLKEEQKQRLLEDGIMEEIIGFNEDFGENLVIQFKDYNKNEIVFNVYVKVNQDDLLYFEPMPYSDVPAEDVKIEFDIEELLNIVEYGDKGRIELQSPPWDKRNEVGFVDGIVDGVRMYFMFRDMLNSATTTPESAEDQATYFTKLFFEVVMGDGDKERNQLEEQEENKDNNGIEQKDFKD